MSTIPAAETALAPTAETTTMSNLPAAETAVTKKKYERKHRPHTFDENNNKRNWKNPRLEMAAGSYANPELRQQLGVVLPDDWVQETEAATSNIDNDSEDDTARSPAKRKVAIFMGYLGSGYCGFQMNAGQRTLQAELELALVRANLVTRRNFGYPWKYGWSVAGRTDKGVHACAQVCSAKLQLGDESLDAARERINSLLPPGVDVMDLVRSTKSFCAKTARHRVRYEYMLPSMCLHPEIRTVIVKHVRDIETVTNETLTDEQVRAIYADIKDYRATPEQLKRLGSALELYQGTNSFHNFTKGVKPHEARSLRFIDSFHVQEPILVNGVEWIPTTVTGQSFLMHQIRKMICVAMDVARGQGRFENQVIERALSRHHLTRLRPAPSQGLFLEMSFYDGYNKRKSQNTNLENIEWHKDGTAANARWKEFRTQIRKHIVEEDAREGHFVRHMVVQEFVYDIERNYSDRNLEPDSIHDEYDDESNGSGDANESD
jgi:tRNA pseudouridine38-40 synthase